MKVTLLDYTGKGHEDPAKYAAAILIFTKSTRLNMNPELFDEVMLWPKEKMLDELKYMANTIPSSWEFIDYTFLVQDVTRAFTHQFVRSRHFSFAQQTMRVLNVKGWNYLTGPSIEKDPALKKNYQSTMEHVARAYDWLIRDGALVEDARGVLPTNILTNIVAKCNMRTFVELVRKRSSSRTQDEYRQVLDAMQLEVYGVHPWIRLFVKRTFEQAAKDLDQLVHDWKLRGSIEGDEMLTAIKLVDQMRDQS